MDCRLFIDEVGNDDLVSESERYLSLTGIITKFSAHERVITREIEELKRDLFGHHPVTNPVILHRKEIVRKEPPFQCLWLPEDNAKWEAGILGLIENLPYIAGTALIDKHEHAERYKVWLYNPYHYCMQALVERYVLWLNRHDLTGDVMAESRFKKEDKALKAAFTYLYEHGTDKIPHAVFQRCLTSREIKLEPKESNVCGLQLVDIIAHPSHQLLKCRLRDEEMTARFGKQVTQILLDKHYARNPKTRQIEGWGLKTLP
jgi:hypothetical protein